MAYTEFFVHLNSQSQHNWCTSNIILPNFVIGHNITKLISNTCELKISTTCSVFCSKILLHTSFIKKAMAQENNRLF